MPRQAGFTLVELLVSMALGLVIMLALIAVYLNVTRTNTEMAKTNGLIENGRFAVDILAEDLSHAGYWGGHVPLYDDLSLRVVPTDVPATATVALGPCVAYADWDTPAAPDYRSMLIGLPVQVYSAVPTGCSSILTDYKSGTDVLVARHLENCSFSHNGTAWVGDTTNCSAVSADKVYFQASLCAVEKEATPPLRYELLKDPTVGTQFQLKLRGCTGAPPAATVGTRAPIRRMVSNIYYIRTWAVTAGDGIPTLMRSSFGSTGGVPVHEPAVALIEGIENMAIEVGIDGQSRCGTATDYSTAITVGAAGNIVKPSDCLYSTVATENTMFKTRGDGVPELFKRCGTDGCTATELRDVVAVKLFVLARSREANAGYSEAKTFKLGSNSPTTVAPTGASAAFKRHVFQTTVRVTNVAARRETP